MDIARHHGGFEASKKVPVLVLITAHTLHGVDGRDLGHHTGHKVHLGEHDAALRPPALWLTTFGEALTGLVHQAVLGGGGQVGLSISTAKADIRVVGTGGEGDLVFVFAAWGQQAGVNGNGLVATAVAGIKGLRGIV